MNKMSEILEEMDKFIASNKDVLAVLPINTKKNKAAYVKKVEEFQETAIKIKKVILNEIQERYDKYLDVREDPKILELSKSIDGIDNIALFNELNTPFEKLGLDKICHSLSSYFEGDLKLLNNNINLFLEIFQNFDITLSEDDFNYSQFVNDYMKEFFRERSKGLLDSDNLKKVFEQIYWKCPNIVTHIEVNMRYLYYINSKKIEKELDSRNEKVLGYMQLDKNELVKKYFELNKDLIKMRRKDAKYIWDKFYTEEWKSKEYSEKEMSVLYDRLSTKRFFECSKDEQEEINKNFGKLLNTLEEYKVFIRFKYIIDDLVIKTRNKDSFKGAYESKNKELRKKEQELLKESKKNKQNIKLSRIPFLKFFRKKLERKIYEFPVTSNAQIKEIKKLYDELDVEKVNKRIEEFVDDNCSIKYMFKIATSFYIYAYNLVKDHYKDEEGFDVQAELQVLIDFIDQPYKVMLNNIKLVEEPNIANIIANRYKILNINIIEENLESDNIEAYMADVEKIVNYHNITRSGVSLDDVTFVENVKPMIEKMNKG